MIDMFTHPTSEGENVNSEGIFQLGTVKISYGYRRPRL